MPALSCLVPVHDIAHVFERQLAGPLPSRQHLKRLQENCCTITAFSRKRQQSTDRVVLSLPAFERPASCR